LEKVLAAVRAGRALEFGEDRRHASDGKMPRVIRTTEEAMVQKAFALALAYALGALGKTVVVVNKDPAPAPLMAFPGVSDIVIADRIDKNYDAAIVLECGELARTGVKGLDRYFIINVDHHPGNSAYGQINWFDDTAAACAELVDELIGALGVPRSRMLLSVPLYGWQWASSSERPGAAAFGKAKLLTYAPTPAALMPNDRLAATALAAEHGLRRDGERTPYYAYRAGGRWVQGWYEDMASLTHKLAPERPRGYAGLAFFPLGYDGGEIVEPLLRWWRAPPT
jgi:hypothetical protein